MLQITEIHPNPEGKDTTNEWIEITNLGPTAINLQNHTIDDEEGGSKPYTIENPTILQPNQLHIISKQESNLNLNNQGDEVRIFTPATEQTQTPLTSLKYGKSTEGLSYSLITIRTTTDEKQTYTWTAPTKNQTNQTYLAFEGTINQPPEIAEEFTFTINEKQTNKELTIIFEEEILNFETATILLTPETNTKLLTSKTSKPETFQLIDFKIAEAKAETETTKTQELQETPPIQTRNPLPISAIIIPLTLTLLLTTTLLFLKKLKKRQKQI